MGKNSGYRAMARFYDAFTDDVPYEKWADYYESLFEKFKKRPKKIADLACGTGTLSHILAKRGYFVTGIDMSEEMLTRACAKAPGVENRPLFVRGRMEDFSLPSRADAVLCGLDSVNYLSGKRALFAAFSSVGRNLKPGGLFIFDVNTARKLKGLHLQSFIREKNGVFLAWQAQYDRPARRIKYYINFFVRGQNGRYTRFEEVHTERAFGKNELFSALERAGLRVRGCFGELSMSPPAPGEGRVFIAAEKI